MNFFLVWLEFSFFFFNEFVFTDRYLFLENNFRLIIFKYRRFSISCRLLTIYLHFLFISVFYINLQSKKLSIFLYLFSSNIIQSNIFHRIIYIIMIFFKSENIQFIINNIGLIWRLINYNNLISIFNIEIRINKDKTNSNIMIIIVASVSSSRYNSSHYYSN